MDRGAPRGIAVHSRAHHHALPLGEPRHERHHPHRGALLPQLRFLRVLARAVRVGRAWRRPTMAGAAQCAARADPLGVDREPGRRAGHTRRDRFTADGVRVPGECLGSADGFRLHDRSARADPSASRARGTRRAGAFTHHVALSLGELRGARRHGGGAHRDGAHPGRAGDGAARERADPRCRRARLPDPRRAPQGAWDARHPGDTARRALMTATTLTRRRFIVTSAAVAGALVIGVAVRELRRAPAGGTAPSGVLNAFVRIAPSGQVTLVMPKVEMGQGTYTSLPMLIAEELEVDLGSVALEPAPPDPAVYGFPVDPEAPAGIERDQATGTSLSIIQCWEPLRQAGATARLMLTQAAAKRWRVPVDSCHAEAGEVIHAASGRRLSYGALARAAAALPVPPPPPLKERKNFRLIGRNTLRRDTPAKVNGSAVFGIDVRPPRARVALIAISPVEGGRIAEPLASEAALAVHGVTQVVNEGDVIAVVAEHTWAAMKGMKALNPRWEGGANSGVQQAAIVAALEAAAREPGVVAVVKGKPVEAD